MKNTKSVDYSKIQEYNISKLIENIILYHNSQKTNKNIKMSNELGDYLQKVCKNESFNLKYKKYSYDQKLELTNNAVMCCLIEIKNIKNLKDINKDFINKIIKNSFDKLIKSKNINYIF